MRLPRLIFAIAAIYGLIVLVPILFLEGRIGRDFPPALTHVEYFYGFLGGGIVMQLLYLLIASDPIRYRPVMLLGVASKWSFGLTCLLLFAQGRMAAGALPLPMIDLGLGALFLLAWLRTPRERPA